MSAAPTIPLDRMNHLVLHALAGAMDRDVDEVADATRPIFTEGTIGDGWVFLCGVLGAIEKFMPGPRRKMLALQFGCVDEHGRTVITEPEDTPPEIVAYGRLLTAYVNRDIDLGMDLWVGAVRADLAGSVLALALDQGGQLLRRRKAGKR